MFSHEHQNREIGDYLWNSNPPLVLSVRSQVSPIFYLVLCFLIYTWILQEAVNLNSWILFCSTNRAPRAASNLSKSCRIFLVPEGFAGMPGKNQGRMRFECEGFSDLDSKDSKEGVAVCDFLLFLIDFSVQIAFLTAGLICLRVL